MNDKVVYTIAFPIFKRLIIINDKYTEESIILILL